MAVRPWTQEELALCEKRLRANVLMKDIAEEIGRSFDSVAVKLRPMARTIKAESAKTPEHPISFTHALRQFKDYRDAAEWMGCNRTAIKAMAQRDWVPEKYWPLLAHGMNYGLGVETVSTETFQTMAMLRGLWKEPNADAADWNEIPDIEKRIKKAIMKKYKDQQLAEDAASHAVIEMMENKKPYLGYGMRVAFCYCADFFGAFGKTVYLSDDDIRQQVEMSFVVPPNQIDAVMLSEVLESVRQMPRHQSWVIEKIVEGWSDLELANKMNVNENVAAHEKASARKLLKAYIDVNSDHIPTA